MIINTNIGASNAARILAESTDSLQKSLKRLSTGSRIASISDDSAGSAVASKFSANIARLNASANNIGNMISFSQTQDGYMEKVSAALERMSEIAMLATDNTKTAEDRAIYGKEFVALQSYISSIGDKTFNGTSLFSSASLSVTVGTEVDGTGIKLALAGANLKNDQDYIDVTTAGTAAVSTISKAVFSLEVVQSAISQLAYDRALVGANLNRLETEKNTLSILRNNLAAAKSRITDVDVAEESANYARQQILVQSGTAMLAQANVLPQSALRLIG